MENLLSWQAGTAASALILLADAALLVEPLRRKPHLIGPMVFFAFAASVILAVGCAVVAREMLGQELALAGADGEPLLVVAGVSIVALVSLIAQGIYAFKYARYLFRLSKNAPANHRDPLFWDMSASAIDHAMDVLYTAPADMNDEQEASLQGLFDWADRQKKRKRSNL